MSIIEVPTENIEDKVQEIEGLLQRLEKYTDNKIKEDPAEELNKARSLLADAERLEIEVGEFKDKFTKIAARYYDEKINRLLGQLEERMNSKDIGVKMSSYLLMRPIKELIEQAKKFEVDMPEEENKLQELDEKASKEIKF